jgi:hypothetical protein
MRKYLSIAALLLATFVHAADAQKAPSDKEAKALALDSLSPSTKRSRRKTLPVFTSKSRRFGRRR